MYMCTFAKLPEMPHSSFGLAPFAFVKVKLAAGGRRSFNLAFGPATVT
jgi:hypothetical protein